MLRQKASKKNCVDITYKLWKQSKSALEQPERQMAGGNSRAQENVH